MKNNNNKLKLFSQPFVTFTDIDHHVINWVTLNEFLYTKPAFAFVSLCEL